MSEPTSENFARNPALEAHLTSRSTWMRLLFMLVMLVLYSVSRIVVTAVIVVQFLHVLFTGQKNLPLLRLGQSLATYTYEIVRYLTFTSDVRPFPFDADWPAGAPEDTVPTPLE